MAIRNAVLVMLVCCALPFACDDGDDGSDWRATGIAISNEMCDKLYDCLTPTELDAVRGVSPVIGATVDECKANYRAFTEAATEPCQTGTYHGETAVQCLDEFRAMSCDDLRASGGAGPLSCNQICR